MEVDIRVWSLEHAMLVPVRFSDAQYIGGSLQSRDVGLLVCRVCYHEQYVDFRFGSEPWHRGRADMFDQQNPIAERVLDPPGLALKEPRPLRVVVDDLDTPDQWR
jgi:hypothetical protein